MSSETDFGEFNNHLFCKQALAVLSDSIIHLVWCCFQLRMFFSGAILLCEPPAETTVV